MLILVILMLLLMMMRLLNKMRLSPQQIHHTPPKLPRFDTRLIIPGGGIETVVLELADFDFRCGGKLLVLFALAPEFLFPGFAEFDVVGGVEGRGGGGGGQGFLVVAEGGGLGLREGGGVLGRVVVVPGGVVGVGAGGARGEAAAALGV